MFQAAKTPNWMSFGGQAPQPYQYQGGALPAPAFQRENPQMRRPRERAEREVYTVEVRNPDGSTDELDIEAPAGLSASDLQQFVSGQQQTPSNPEPSRPMNPMAAWGNEGIRGFSGALQGAGHVMDNAAELAQGAYNQTLGRVFGQSDSATRANQAGGGVEALANRLPEGNAAGRFLGETGMSALLTRGLPGPLTQGAGAGALMSDSPDALGVARDAAVGGIAGFGADRLMRGARALIAPNVPQAARELHARGVALSPGQAIPPLRRTEEMLMSRPFVGEQITRQRQAGYRDFNRAALDEVVGPYNAVAPRPVRVPSDPGHGAVRSVGDQLSNRYEQLIPNLALVPDTQLATDIQTVAAAMTNGELSPSAARQFQTIVRNQITPHLGRGAMTGEAYRQIERRLGDKIRRYAGSTAPDDQAMAQAFEDMQEAFQGALARSNPRYSQELTALNTSWRNLVRVEDAAGGQVREGLFSPAQFRQAVRRGDHSTRHRGMARGEAPMQDLANAGNDILPSQYPDSGTAGRSQANNPLDPRYWYGAAQGLAYGPGVQQGIVNAAMLPRPAFAQPVADALGQLPAAQAGAYGANALIPGLFGPRPY